jgi:cytochrome c oxidase subunit 2
MGLALGSLALLLGCEMPLALEPRGPAAAEMARLWWFLFWTATVVSVIVFLVLGWALYRAWRGKPVRWSQEQGTAFVLIGGGVIPTIILLAVLVMILASMARFEVPEREPSLVIDVTGHMFWWQAEYREAGFTTANEIHIPVGEVVQVNLHAADVIHSFWVPQLHGKIEMVPGRENVMYFQADEPGVYFGKCAEFCGIQHANMEFLMIAEEREAFEAWLEHQQQEAAEPASELAERGREVFVASPCALCHTVRGVSTAAVEEAGPDLTHLMSRRTLAARMLENNPGNLAGWIVDPQGLKPGNQMPAVTLDADELQALLAFLQGLE